MQTFLEREGVVEEDPSANMLPVRHRKVAELKGAGLQPR